MSKAFETGVVFVHGIQGRPEQFDFLVRALPPDVAARRVLLPGHGKTVREFRKCGADDFADAVRKECGEMLSLCEKVYFVGHSMGCLLGLLAQDGGCGFSGMMLIACPFRIRLTAGYFRNGRLAFKTKGNTDDPFVRAAYEANGVGAKSPAEYLICLKPYAGLMKLVRMAGKLPAPECRTEFFFSEKDEIVSPLAKKTAEKMSPYAETLGGCGHNYFTDGAKKRLAEALLKMIGKDCCDD